MAELSNGSPICKLKISVLSSKMWLAELKKKTQIYKVQFILTAAEKDIIFSASLILTLLIC